MAWYDKNKTPEWKTFIDQPYLIQSLLNSKDLIIKQILKVDEVQIYVKSNSHNIVQDCLKLCLQQSNPQSSYDRKYSLPTKAIELMTTDVFFSCLAWDRSLVQQYIHLMFQYFSTVHPHRDNINLYDGYLSRLFKMVLRSKMTDKLDIISAIQIEQKNHRLIENLFSHSHKMAAVSCIRNILKLDFLEPILTSLDIKQLIINTVFRVIEQYHQEGNVDIDRLQNCLYLIKKYLEKAASFFKQYNIGELISKQRYHTPQYQQKIQHFICIYSILQSKFHLLVDLIFKNGQNSIKTMVFDILKWNQRLLLQIQRAEIKKDWINIYSQKIINFMMNCEVKIFFPDFLEWLFIFLSNVGENSQQIESIIRLNFIERSIAIITSNHKNNIVVVRMVELLKMLFENVEMEIRLSIETFKNVDIKLIRFNLLYNYLSKIHIIQSKIRQFKSINDPLFTALFKFYKIISIICSRIDQIFTYYDHLEICRSNKPAINRLIEFQKTQPCFNVFQRQVFSNPKSLGEFYSDDLFIAAKPTQFTVNKNSVSTQVKSHLPILSEETQSFIVLQAATISPTLIQSNLDNKPKTPQIILSKSQKLIEQPRQISFIKLQSEKTIQPIQNNEEDKKNKFNSFIQTRIKETTTDLHQNRSKSRTPTKIKNELKKSKNKWSEANQENGPQNSKLMVNVQMKQNIKKTYSSPKMSKQLSQCVLQKILLLKITKSRTPKIQTERLLNKDRDGRLLDWLKVMRK